MSAPEPSLQDLSDFLKSVGGMRMAGSGGGTSFAVSPDSGGLTTVQLEEVRNRVDRPPAGLVLLKYGSRSVVGVYPLGDGRRVVMKYYYPRGFHKHLSYGIKGSRCMRSWTSAMAFQYLGIATPPAIMVAEWHAFGGLWFHKSTLVTGEAAGVTLADWLVAHDGDSERLLRMADRLRAQFDRMARYRISHGDLKQSNILIGGGDEPVFVDLDAVTFHSSERSWLAGREKDAGIFRANWNQHPQAAKAFANVIS